MKKKPASSPDLFAALDAPPHPRLLSKGVSPSDFRMTDSLADVVSWQARVIEGESQKDSVRKGEFERVGYIMVRAKGEPGFIPIALSDSHHTGFSALSERARKWGINQSDYYPIYCLGNNYIYSDSHEKIALEALKLWHAEGGPDLPVIDAGYDGRKRWRLSSRDFIAGKGKPTVSKDGLYPIGQRFVDATRGLNDAIKVMRDPNVPSSFIGSASQFKSLDRAARKFVDVICDNDCFVMSALYGSAKKNESSGFLYGAKDYDQAVEFFRKRIDSHLENEDVFGIYDVCFRHGGPKCRIHSEVRAAMLGKGGSFNDMAEVFGNVSLAHDLLGRISPGLDDDNAMALVTQDPAPSARRKTSSKAPAP